MKNCLKKTISIVMLTAVLLTGLFGFSAMAIEKNDSYTRLIEAGFPEDYLNCITEGMMNKILSYLGDCDVSVLSYVDDGKTANYGETEDISLKKIIVVLKDKNNGKIMGEFMSVYWTWKKGKPIVKQRDQVNLMLLSDNFIYDGESFYAEDYQISDSGINISKTYTSPARIRNISDYGPASISYSPTLKYFGGTNSGCVSFNLIPCNSDITEYELRNDVYVEYNHYYKFTVFMTVLICVIFAVALIVPITVHFKKKNNI